jgi:hypothetical protein
VSKHRTLTADMVSGKVLDRFKAKVAVDVSPEHVGFSIWTATLNPKSGTGSFWTGPLTSDVYPAHRVAYAIAHGEAPASRIVRQSCGIGHCVDSTHLVLSDEAAKVVTIPRMGTHARAKARKAQEATA